MKQIKLDNSPFAFLGQIMSRCLAPLLLCLLFVTSACSGLAPPVDPGSPKPTTALDLSRLVNLLPPDSIPSIDQPRFDPAAEAHDMRDDERVIGLIIEGDARAYPLTILSSHEIVNDVVGGEPVAVTWCPLCYTALVFSRNIEGFDDPVTFGVSGMLLRNTLVMFDREGGSLWSQLYGQAIDGDQVGTQLAFLPSTLTDWATWRSTYPDSLVLSKQQTRIQFSRPGYAVAPRGSYDVDAYVGYYAAPDEGVVDSNVPRDDASLRPKRKVLGVRVDGSARAYPFHVLRDQPVVNDQLRESSILVWYDVESATPRAYDRRVGDHVLTFEPSDHPLVLRDAETGSTWQMLDGTAVDGPLKGTILASVIATTAFEFGWYGYFPESDTFGKAGE